MLRGLVSLIHANPAVSAAIMSIVGGLAAKFGFHLTAAQIAEALTVVNVLLMAWVHGKVTPVAKLPKPAEPPAA
jgi:hypothetical protein